MTMKRFLSTIIILCIGLAVFGQNYVFNFPKDTTADGTEFIPFQTKVGSDYLNWQMPFPYAKRYFSPNVVSSAVLFDPETATTGQKYNYLGKFVTYNNFRYYIDGQGLVVKLGNPNATGVTDLSVGNRTATGLDVVSNTGNDAAIPLATSSLAGLMSAADKAKLDVALTSEVDGSTTNELTIFYAQASAPGGVKLGDMWWKNTGDSIFVFNGSWVFFSMRNGGGDGLGELYQPDGKQLVVGDTVKTNIVDVYILWGQSNMNGQTPTDSCTVAELKAQTKTAQWQFKKFSPLCLECRENKFRPSPGFEDYFGPELGIHLRHSSIKKNPAYIIKLAKGATSISNFLPGTSLWRGLRDTMLIPALKEIMAKGQQPRVSLETFQGENDAIAGLDTAILYQARITLLIDSIRAIVGEDMPCVLAKIKSNGAAFDTINAHIQRVADNDPLITTIPTNTLNFYDTYHLQYSAMKRAGALFVDSVEALGGGYLMPYLLQKSPYDPSEDATTTVVPDSVFGNILLSDVLLDTFGREYQDNYRIWTARTNAAANSWRGITWGKDKFVAVSEDGTGNRVMTSQDGINWTSRTTPTSPTPNSMYAVTYGGGTIVSVGYGGNIASQVLTSPDGVTWAARTAAASKAWFNVKYMQHLKRFVAVAGATSSSGNRVMYSDNLGVTWTSASATADRDWRGLAYGDSTLIAISYIDSTSIMTSPDGITWTARYQSIGNHYISLAYGNGRFVAVSDDGTNNMIMVSKDRGLTWTAKTTPAAANAVDWRSITYDATSNVFVCVGQTGTNRVMIGTGDGENWVMGQSAASNNWRGVCCEDGICVAVASTGTGNRVMTSGVGKKPVVANFRGIKFNGAAASNGFVKGNGDFYEPAGILPSDIPDISATYAKLTGATFSGPVNIPSSPYDPTNWNGSTKSAQEDAVRDKLETMIQSATATIDFVDTAPGECVNQVITLTGAVDGDVVSLGVPSSSMPVNGSFSAYVSGPNSVTVRYCNCQLAGNLNPPSGTFKVSILR
jgi:hypothetical protein